MDDQQTNPVDSTDARKASMSRVVTQDDVLSSLVSAEPAIEAASEEEPEVKQEEKNDKPKVKHSAQERISELANKRRAAEKEAENARRENSELRARIRALETSATPVTQDDKPTRSQFMTEDQYIESLTDWKAKKAIIEREQQQQQARMNAEMQEIDASYTKTIESAKSRYDDFVEVVSAATTEIPSFIVMALKESEIGGDLTYYLSKHSDECKKLVSMRPVQALKYLDRLERDLLEPDVEEVVEKAKPVAKKKAPEPISPVRGSSPLPAGNSQSFEEYRARRKAQR